MRNYCKVMPHQLLKGPPPQDTGGRGVKCNDRPRVHSGMTLYVSLDFVKTSANNIFNLLITLTYFHLHFSDDSYSSSLSFSTHPTIIYRISRGRLQ